MELSLGFLLVIIYHTFWCIYFILFLKMLLKYLTFRGPCIVIYSYNKSQLDTLFLKFILIKYPTCFKQIYCPSSGVSTLYTKQ